MGNGSLSDCLFRMNSDPLPWKKRLEICINVARGLQHMHSSLNQILILHLDITTDNIMLDKDWVPKFLLDINWFHLVTGLMYKDILVPSKVATICKRLTHLVSTKYYAPEQIRSGGVMKESHVYSFGVVLLDVLYGRKALEPMLHCGHQTSVDYLFHKQIKRPSMDDVVGRLEFILELLETSGDHGQFSVASKDHQSEVSFKEAVYQAYNNALFYNNDPLLIDSDYIVMNPNATSFSRSLNQFENPNSTSLSRSLNQFENPNATSFSGSLNQFAMSLPTFDDSDYHSSNLAR